MIRLHGLLRLSSLFVAMATATAAHALGVGEVSLNSRLNQPLDAKIALFEAAGLDSDEVIVKLASPEAFERVGLDRPYFLTDLKFSPKLQGTQGNIIVTSSKPVREPYLSFLIEVIWPNGRMLREYTLLLDPPIYAQTQQATAPTPPQTPTQPSERPAVAATTAPPVQATPPQQPPVQPAQPTRPATAETAQTASSVVSPGGQYQTQSNDTLWEIANNFSPPGSNVHQAMLAIQDLNPKAFIDSNINLLKKGQVLRLPDEQQIKSRTAAVALKEVAQQNNAWRESRGLAAEQRQINATRREVSNAPSQQAEASDSLRLVAATQQGSTSALNERLAAAQENLDSSRRENEELKSRMSDLEGQLEKLQRLVELKDASLAKLQAQLERANVAESMATTPANDVSQNAQENSPFSTERESNAPIAEAIDEQEAVTIPQTTQTTLETTSSAQEERQWWESLLENSLLLWIGGGGLLLALLLVAARSRSNARKWAERELEADNFDDEETAFVDLSGLDSSDTTFDKPLKATVTEPAKNTKASVQSALAQETPPDDFVSFEPVAPPTTSDNKANLAQELDAPLDDFADFDLQFGDNPLPADNTSNQPTLDLTAELENTSIPSLSKDDNELGFVLDDNFDDFTPLSDNEPFVETTNDASLMQETLDDLDFAELSHITEPPVVAESEQPKPRQAAEFKAADDDFDFLSDTDETETKLDLARAYIDMGDMEGARDILDEVMNEGSDSQKTEAQELMTSLA